MMRASPLLAILAAVLVLAACGALPRPFPPAEKTPPAVLEAALGARAGVFVEPIPGLAEGESERLTGALVLALGEHDVAAGRRASNRASYRISAQPGEAGKLHWRLAEPGGTLVLEFDDHGEAGRAQTAARRFAEILNPATPSAANTVLVLAVQPVDGAPGDGRRSLTRAMRRALSGYGLNAALSLENASFIVLGSVYVSEAPGSGADQSIAVDWTILTPNGERIGTVNQSNVVPKGTLDGVWGAVARAVAENGAEGIVAMLERVGALE